jgi:inner membrane protein
MNGRTHLVLGLAVGVAVAAAAPPDLATRAMIIVAGGIGGLLPDIDHPKSIVSGYLPGVGGAVRLFASHRGPTHSLFFLLTLLALLFAINAPQWVVAAGAGGFISHLLADMATVAGVPVLLPISRRSFRLAPALLLGPTQWILESVATVGAIGAIGFILWKGL